MKKENFSEEYIRTLQTKSHRDPILLERTVYAFGLLEALVKARLPFIFKGGTCLMLLTPHPRRLSTDIDIIVNPETDIDEYLERASKIFPFKYVEEQKRIGKNNIEKRHFKFSYNSPINNRPLYILLDVLFERNHYTELIEKEIKNELLLTEPDLLSVTLPSINCILADKLTAFAPHTIGIPLNCGKDMEVMKQFYDITTLLNHFTDFNHIWPTYQKIAQSEIEYRGINISVEECLWDTFNTSLCLASRGKTNKSEFPLYVKGIRDLRGHIYQENYTPEIAAARATKVMYMVTCLLTNTTYQQVENIDEYLNKKLTQKNLLSLLYFRKIDPEAYAYVIKTDELISNSMTVRC